LASEVFYKASVEKDLKRIDKAEARQLLTKLEHALSANPNVGEPLAGDLKGLFKCRIGDYRVVYGKIMGGVLVVRIAHRREVYR